MLLSLLIFLLVSNAVNIKKEKSLLYSRIVIITFIYSSILTYTNLYTISLEESIGIYGGLFNVTTFTQ